MAPISLLYSFISFSLLTRSLPSAYKLTVSKKTFLLTSALPLLPHFSAPLCIRASYSLYILSPLPWTFSNQAFTSPLHRDCSVKVASDHHVVLLYLMGACQSSFCVAYQQHLTPSITVRLKPGQSPEFPFNSRDSFSISHCWVLLIMALSLLLYTLFLLDYIESRGIKKAISMLVNIFMYSAWTSSLNSRFVYPAAY